MFYYKKKKYSNPLLTNDPKIIEEVYKKALPLIIRKLSLLGASIDDAKDLLQEAMITMLYKEEGDIDTSFLSYLLGICRNKWISELRKQKNNSSIEDNEVAIIKLSQNNFRRIEEEEKVKLKVEKVLVAYSKLSPNCKKLLEHQLEFSDLPLKKEAERLNMKYSAYTTAKSRANFKLKEKFKQLFGL